MSALTQSVSICSNQIVHDYSFPDKVQQLLAEIIIHLKSVTTVHGALDLHAYQEQVDLYEQTYEVMQFLVYPMINEDPK